MPTVLTLAPAQGGTRFGPHSGTFYLGTDRNRCQVALPPWPGIAPIHAALTENGGGWMVQPHERGLELYLYRGGQYWPVTDAVSMQPGDILVVGSQQGAALTPELQGGASIAGPQGQARSQGSSRMPTSDAMAREVKRQAQASLMTKGPFQDVARFFYQFQSGALMRPRNLIALAGALIMMVGTAVMSCFGIIASLVMGS